MTPGRKILVVAQNTSLASTLLTWLSEAHHELVIANTFAAAKLHLASRPDLLIAEVKLGEYNGLHLALRGRALGVPAIVVGATDVSFKRQAEQLGAVYVPATELVDAPALDAIMHRVLDRPDGFVESPPVQWYCGLMIQPISIDAGVGAPELPLGPVPGRTILVH
jgi:DNA-binding response OmpR family regulator